MRLDRHGLIYMSSFLYASAQANTRNGKGEGVPVEAVKAYMKSGVFLVEYITLRLDSTNVLLFYCSSSLVEFSL